MRRKNIYPLLPLFVLAVGFYYYTQNFPHIFDIALYDESGYMHRGQAPGLLNFSNYEWAPLYSLFYRTVSLHANALRLPLEPFAARFPATAISQ